MLYIRSLYTFNLYNLYIKSLEASMLHTWNFVPFNQHLPISPTLPHLVPAVLFSASMYLTVLDTTCKWDYEDFFSSCVWLISLSIMLSHPHMLLQMARSPFLSLNNIHIMYIHIHIYTNIYGLPWWLSGKESTCNTVGLIPRWERSCGEGNGNTLQYSCLESPWTEEPGGLQSTGPQRFGHSLATEQQKQIHIFSNFFFFLFQLYWDCINVMCTICWFDPLIHWWVLGLFPLFWLLWISVQ